MKSLLVMSLLWVLGCSSTPDNEFENELANENVEGQFIEEDGNFNAENAAIDNSESESEFAAGNEVYESLNGEEVNNVVENEFANIAQQNEFHSLNLQGNAQFGEVTNSTLNANVASAPAVSNDQAVEENTDVLASVWWIGYNFDKKNKMLRIQILTKGLPQYDLKNQLNENAQPELVVQFPSTRISKRIIRDINATEFPAPVSFIRSEDDGVDAKVILTLRERMAPEIFAAQGNVQLSFPLNEKYLNMAEKGKVSFYKVASLTPDEDVLPMISRDSQQPISNQVVFKPEPARHAFKGKPEPTPESVKKTLDDLGSGATPKVKPGQDTSPVSHSSQGSILSRQSVMGIAQDNLEFGNDVQTLEPNTIDGEGFSGDLEQAAITEEIDGSEEAYRVNEYSGKTIHLEFHQAALGQVLKAFSAQIGTNFVFPPDVGEVKVTIKLSGVPWDAALNAMLETYKLGMARVSQNVIRIDRIVRMNEYLDLRQKSDEARILTQPKKVLVSKLSYGDAERVAEIIKAFLSSSVAPESLKVAFSKRTNTVIVEAPPPILSRVKAVIEKVDVASPQVEVKARLVEVLNTNQNFLGISWGGTNNYDANRGLGFGSLTFPNSMNSIFSVDPGVSGKSSAGSAAINLGSINDVLDIDLRLQMEKQKGTTEILQNNRVVVADREKANIYSGKKLYFITGGSSTVVVSSAGETPSSGASVEAIEFNLELNVTPHVTNNGFINLDLDISSESASAATEGVAAGSSRRGLKTKMIKKSGQTGVIGGIYDTSKKKSEIAVPFFSSIPLIGPLFRSRTYSESQTEMMVFITPTIMPLEQQNTEFTETTAVQTEYDNSFGNTQNISLQEEGNGNGNYNQNYNQNSGNYNQNSENGNQDYNNVNPWNESNQNVDGQNQNTLENFNEGGLNENSWD